MYFEGVKSDVAKNHQTWSLWQDIILSSQRSIRTLWFQKSFPPHRFENLWQLSSQDLYCKSKVSPSTWTRKSNQLPKHVCQRIATYGIRFLNLPRISTIMIGLQNIVGESSKPWSRWKTQNEIDFNDIGNQSWRSRLDSSIHFELVLCIPN